MRRLGVLTLLAMVLSTALAVPAARADALLGGGSISIRSGSTLSVTVPGALDLPTVEQGPTTVGATLLVYDIGTESGDIPRAGGVQEIELPADGWSVQFKKGVPKGYVYVGDGTGADPCTSVKVTADGIAARCQAGITLTTPFDGDAAMILTSGDDRFCATWGGTTKRNNAVGMERLGSPVVDLCPAVLPGPDTFSTLTPHFGLIEVVKIPVLLNDYAPNPAALRIVDVTQPLKADGAGLRQVGKLTIADDGRSVIYDMDPPECVPQFDPAYDPMLVCCPQRLLCDADGIAATYTVSDGVTQATQTITLNISMPDEIPFSLEIHNLYYPVPNQATELYVSPPSDDLNIPRPVTVTAEAFLPVLNVVSTDSSQLLATIVVQGTCPTGSLATICDVTITSRLPADSVVLQDGFSLASTPLNVSLAQPLVVEGEQNFLSVRVIQPSDSGDPAPAMSGYFGVLTDLQRENCWVDQRQGIREVC